MKGVFASAVILAGAIAACKGDQGEIETTTAATQPLATVTLNWTIDGSTDEPMCATESASVIDVSVRDPETGRELEAFQERCESFALTMDLAAGTYVVRARLLDATGKPRTPDVTSESITLEGDAVVLRNVDFSSFL